MIESIMSFQSEGRGRLLDRRALSFYPQIDREHALSLPFPERKGYIESTMRAVYAETRPEIRRKAELYNRHWDECEAQIAAALSDAFDVDCAGGYNDIVARVGLDPYRRGSCGSGLSTSFT